MRTDGENSASRGFHRIHGVADEMKEHLKQLIRIALNPRKQTGSVKVDPDIFAVKIQPPQLHGAIEYRAEIEQLLLGGSLTRKAQQVIHESFGPARLLLNFFRQ